MPEISAVDNGKASAARDPDALAAPFNRVAAEGGAKVMQRRDPGQNRQQPPAAGRHWSPQIDMLDDRLRQAELQQVEQQGCNWPSAAAQQHYNCQYGRQQRADAAEEQRATFASGKKGHHGLARDKEPAPDLIVVVGQGGEAISTA